MNRSKSELRAGFKQYGNSFLLIIGLILSVLILFGCSAKSEKTAAEKKGVNEIKKRSLSKKRVLYINSYHRGYEWSDRITETIMKVFNAKLNDDYSVDNSNSIVELKIICMDTKQNPSLQFKKAAALKAKNVIDTWKPDAVIASDDNASAYLIGPYFKNKELPFVFCGINGSAEPYGFPCSNVTGMIEIQLIDQIIQVMRQYAEGDRVAFLAGDNITNRKEAIFFEKEFNLNLEKIFVSTFKNWKNEYLRLQNETDMLFLSNFVSIANMDKIEAEKIIRTETKIPSGNWDSWLASYTLITFATNPAEQGEWSAKTVLSILDGKSPAEIPIVKNKKAKVYLNMKLAEKLNIIFPEELIEDAELVE